MYSPVERPSRMRAAPAKKRRLSAQTGISSRAAGSGLPTFCDSSWASSSAFSSTTSASLSSASERSCGVVSSHSGSAFFAASTARSTSPSVPRGTSAIVSPVEGLMTSMVSPSTAPTHSPPTKFSYVEVVTVMVPSLSSPKNPGVARQSNRDHDRNDGQDDNREDDRVDDRELGALADVVEDEDRQRRLRAGGERGHDHLVEGEGEGEQPAGDEGSRHGGPQHVAKGLPAVGAEVHRGLDDRG